MVKGCAIRRAQAVPVSRAPPGQLQTRTWQLYGRRFPLGSEQPKQLRSTSETGITRHDGDDGTSLLEWEHGPAVAFQASRRPLADSHKRMSTFPAVCCLLWEGSSAPQPSFPLQVYSLPPPSGDFHPCKFQSRPCGRKAGRPPKSRTNPLIMDLGFVKDGDSTLMFTLTPPQTKDAGIEVSKGCYCFVIDVSGR